MSVIMVDARVCTFAPPPPLPSLYFLTSFSPPPSASLPGDHSSIFCAIFPGFQLMTPGIPRACPLFIFTPPNVKKGRDGEGVG